MRRQMVVIVLLIWLGACLPVTAGEDWPGFRGPNHDGAAPDAGLFDGSSAALSLGWKRSLGSGYSAIAVVDGRVVTMFTEAADDLLAAFDAQTGDELWRYRIAEAYPGHNGSHDGPISTPLISGGRVHALGPRGHLVAVDAASGEPLWTQHLVDDFAAREPFYGFTTSPLLADGVLIVEVGTDEHGESIAGFDPASGELLWRAGHDTFEYHSPVVATIGGREQVLAAGKSTIYGLDAKSGEVLWSHEHGGDERAMGGFTIVPLPAGEGRVFLMNKIDGSTMLQIAASDGKYEARELWTSSAIKRSYVTPVYRDGSIYGMSNRIFICMDAATGEIRWRSREPGDGFPTLIGDKLVIMTKPGSLHVAEASPEGYHELARLDLFDEHSWSEVAFADGHLFARSMASLARVDVGTAADAPSAGAWISGTSFGGFLAQVGETEHKNAIVDAFLANVDFGEDPLPDPLNSRHAAGLFGEVSWFAMPGWQRPADLGDAEPARQGRLEKVEWGSAIGEGATRVTRVYLPAGYDDGDRRYPVIYVHGGREALEQGVMKNALDQLIGRSVEPLIAVFVFADEENPRRDLYSDEYAEMIVAELVPKIDETFRTIDDPLARGSVGAGRGAGDVALISAFKHPELFRRTAGQSTTLSPEDIEQLEQGADGQPMVVYLDWGSYHMRSPHEAWDIAVENRKLWVALREAGYRPAGGERNEGFGWPIWRAHTEALLTAIFPLRN